MLAGHGSIATARPSRVGRRARNGPGNPNNQQPEHLFVDATVSQGGGAGNTRFAWPERLRQMGISLSQPVRALDHDVVFPKPCPYSIGLSGPKGLLLKRILLVEEGS